MQLDKSFIARQDGFTLIELMVGLLIGTIIVSGIILTWSLAIRSNSYILSTTALNSDLRSVMQLMTQDIRRATPGDTYSSIYLYPESTDTTASITRASCILYESTTATPSLNSTIDRQNFSGFRLHQGNLQMWFGSDPTTEVDDEHETTRESILEAVCNSEEDEPTTVNTNSGRWFTLISPDDRGITLETLEFLADEETISGVTRVRSLCLDLTEPDRTSTDPNEFGRCPTTVDRDSAEVIFLDISMSGTIALPGGLQQFELNDAVKVRNDRIIIN